MTSSAWTLKAAVRAALEADAPLIAMLGNPPPVHDRVPDGAVLPYIAFSDWKVNEDDVDDARIDVHVFTVEVWSAYAGLKEAKAVAELIESALHGAALALTGHTLVDLSFIGAAFAQEPKEGLSQAAMRFRALTQKV